MRFQIFPILTVLLIAALPGGSAAEQTLTLTLEPPALSRPTDTVGTTQRTESKAKAAQDKQSWGVTVGRVGEVSAPSAHIYQSRSTSSRKLSSCRQNTPLAIVREEGDWLGVLMTDGSIGWIQATCVQMTSYQLVADKPLPDRGSFASRGGVPDRTDAHVLENASDLIRTAMGYSGVRYVFGGTNPETGMDCSAFVQAVFARHGIRLPRTSREQANVGQSVPFDRLQPGDRLYFACRNPYIDHCGIYIGDGYFIHCSSGRNGVGIDSLASDFYWRSLVTARR